MGALEKREELQRLGLNLWAKAGFRGILQWATGTGKTYAAIRAIEYQLSLDSNSSILVVCPTKVVIENFKKEFIKAKKRKLLPKVKFICYASLLKNSGNYDLVVFDEIHHLSENKMKFFEKSVLQKLLGLSASLTTFIQARLYKYMKVVHTIKMEDIKDDNIVSDFYVINYKVKLTSQEAKDYKRYTYSIERAYEDGKTAWGSVNKRARILYSAENKINAVKGIVDLFPKEYGLLFSLTKATAEELAEMMPDICTAYHSSYSAKVLSAKLKKFVDKRTKLRLLSTPRVLDEGVTVPGLSYGISVASYSKPKQFIQRLGRLVRLDYEGKKGILIRLYVEDTVEENWIERSQEQTNVIYVESLKQLEDELHIIRKSA